MSLTSGQTVSLTRSIGNTAVTGTVTGLLSDDEQRDLLVVAARHPQRWYWVVLHRHGHEANLSHAPRRGDFFHAAGLEARA